MKKLLFSLYALVSYLIFFASFLYLIGFVENISQFSFAQSLSPLFSTTLDFGETSLSTWPAALINLALIALFGIQHSVMARGGFKQKWTKFIPEPIERSTYMLFTVIVLGILFYFWQPVNAVIWDLKSPQLSNIFIIISLIGWVMVLITTFLINHFDLFGLRQVYYYLKNKKFENIEFKTPSLYKMVRHPMYLGFLIAFWFAPLMTLGHLIFSIGMSVYILIGIYHEEKDLVNAFGENYMNYQMAKPKVIPFFKKPKR